MTEFIEDKYLLSCWDKIDSLPEGGEITVARVAPNKPALWVECAKQWIDVYGNGEFNMSYTVFKKLETIWK